MFPLGENDMDAGTETVFTIQTEQILKLKKREKVFYLIECDVSPGRCPANVLIFLFFFWTFFPDSKPTGSGFLCVGSRNSPLLNVEMKRRTINSNMNVNIPIYPNNSWWLQLVKDAKTLIIPLEHLDGDWLIMMNRSQYWWKWSTSTWAISKK